MKPVLTRVFLLAVLASSISAVALAASFDDEKMSQACPPAGASAQGVETNSQPEKKLKKEKQKMKKEIEQKNTGGDNYPGFGIYG